MSSSAPWSQTPSGGVAPSGPLPAATFILVADGTAPPIGFLNRATPPQVAELLAPLVGAILAGNPTPAPASTETGTLSGVPTAGTAGTALATSGTFSLTNAPGSGTTAYVGLFNVSAGAYQGALQAVTGSSGSLPTLTPASAAGAATYAVRLCADSAGATVLATSPNIAVAVAAAAPAPTPAAASQPTGVTLSNAVEMSMTLAWTAPSNGPTPTAYDLALSTDGGATFVSQIRQSGDPMIYSAVFGSLVPGTSYIARVTGVTGDVSTGTLGAPSANSNTLSTTATTSPPTTPTSFSGTPAGASATTAIYLSWAGAIPPYVASATLTQRTPSGSGNFVPSTYTYRGNRFITARGLTPGSSYDFELVLTNSIGSTPAVTLTNVSTASA
jgi:hypothetical protein